MKRIIILTVLILSSIFVYATKYTINSLENNRDNVFKINDNFQDITVNKVDNFRIFTTTPTASDLTEGQMALFYSGTVYRVYFKINGQLKSALLN